MPLLATGDYRPDVSDYEGQATRNILNVIPRGDGYGPFPSFSAYAKTLPGACRGGFFALKSDGSVLTFAATVDRLYLLNNTDFSWTPVSLPANCTISNASPGVVTYANSFAAGDPVVFSTTGALPSPLVAGTTYYVIAAGLSGSVFRVSATAGGAAINTTTNGSGTHSVTSIYSALTSTANWQFAQTGNLVFATQANAVLQVYDMSSATAFAAALGSPPQAAYISVVGRFLVLSGLSSAPYRVQWSGLNNFNASTSWDNVTLSSNYQDLPDGGIVRGVAGGDQSGIIFQDQAVRAMAYVPGSPVIFQIEKISHDKGLYAAGSIIRAGEKIFFYANQGFHKIEPGGVPVQIGRERVDRTFLADLDKGNLQLFMGAADPRSSRIYWAYKSVAGTAGVFDKALGYDFVLDRFFPVSMSGQYLLGVSPTGPTLESLDAISSSIDAMTLSLDNYAAAIQPQLAMFDGSNVLGFFSGANLEGFMQSSEQGTDGAKITLRGFRPITDAPVFYGSVSYRDTQATSPIVGTETANSARTGRIDIRRESRYQRYKVRIAAGTNWTFCAGYEPDVTTGGTQ